jgi:hypothetical protein
MMKIDPASRVQFQLQFACDVLLKLIEVSDNPLDPSLAVAAVEHAGTIIDAIEHSGDDTRGAH